MTKYIKSHASYDSDEELYSVIVGDLKSNGKPKDKLFIALGRNEKIADVRADMLIEFLNTQND